MENEENVRKYRRLPLDLTMEAMCEDTMLMDISTKDMNLIINGEKTVLIQRKLPNEAMIRKFITKNKQIKVYLYNKEKAVFGECFCLLSFNNDLDKEQRCFFPYQVPLHKTSWNYDEELKGYLDQIREINKNINLKGTCLSYDDFIKFIGIGQFIFFIIKKLVVYEEPLQIDDFYIARFGRNGFFAPADSFKTPRGWCYAIKKNEKRENK